MGKNGREGIKGEEEMERKGKQGWEMKGKGRKRKGGKVSLPQQFSKAGAWGPALAKDRPHC